MGRLVLTRFNRLTWKAEQLTIDNVELEAQYVDDFGRYTTIIKLKRDNPNCLQKAMQLPKLSTNGLLKVSTTTKPKQSKRELGQEN